MKKVKITRGAVLAVLVLAAAVPSSRASAGDVLWEVGAAALCEAGAGLLGYAITRAAFGDPYNKGPFDDTHEVNAAGALIGLSLFATYPLAATAGTYLAGEKAGYPTANKGATFGYTTLAAYGQTLLFVGGAAALRAADDDVGEEAYVWALAADAATKPVVTTFVYHKAKRPTRPPEDSRLPAIEPYVCATTGEDRSGLRLYGVSLSF